MDVGYAVALLVLLVGIASVVQLWVRSRLARGGVVYRLRLPEEIDRARVAQMLAGAAVTLRRGGPRRPWLGFELEAVGSEVVPRVFCSAGVSPLLVESLFGEALPGVKLIREERVDALPAGSLVRRAVALVPSGRGQAVLQTEFATDPSGLLVRLLGDQAPGERAGVQLLFAAASGRARSRLLVEGAGLRGGRPRRSWAEGVLGVALGLVREVFELRPPAALVPPGRVELPLRA